MQHHFDPAVGQKDRYQSVMNRYDYNVSNVQRTNLKWYRNERQDYTGDLDLGVSVTRFIEGLTRMSHERFNAALINVKRTPGVGSEAVTGW